MQMQAISNNTLAPILVGNKNQSAKRKELSFGAIFQPKKVNFNKVQEPISDSIKKAMRESVEKFKGQTAERFYKSKGLDFILSPRTSESVSLSAFRGLKETDGGVDKGCTFSDRIYIGEYGKNSEFRISDIEAGIKEKNRINILYRAVTLTAILTFITLSMISPRKRIQGATKPLIENVDSAANKEKAALQILEDRFELGTKR